LFAMKRFMAVLLLAAGVAGGFYAGTRYARRSPDRLFSSMSAVEAPAQLRETGHAFSEIVKSASPAVVNLSTVKVFDQSARLQPFMSEPFFRDFFAPPGRGFGERRSFKEQSMGSGVIVSADGYILTNSHVVEDVDEITVTLHDRREYRAEIVGFDTKTDLAVIRIAKKGLSTIKWGDSDSLQVGEFVLAIGSPFGLARTVTMGIISATGRADVGIADYEDFIQTDAAINPGNSGGPLVNIRGELVGINTAIFSKSGGYQGIGFAVPGNMAKSVMEQLVRDGRVSRGWLGVIIQDVTPGIAAGFGLSDMQGALVGDVAQGSPAERSGLRRGDVVIEFGGKKVRDVASFRNMVAATSVGRHVPMQVWREGKQSRVTVEIVELPTDSRELKAPAPQRRHEPSSPKTPLGMSVIGLSRDVARQLDIAPGERGVVVARVEPGGPADEAGLRKGDIIHEINGVKITAVRDFDRALMTVRRDKPALLYVSRAGRRFYVSITE